jgi:hypothetical protein
LFGALIESASRPNVFAGYAVGSALVLAAAAIAWRWAVDAEGKPLEALALRPEAAEGQSPVKP